MNNLERRAIMPTAVRQKDDHIKVKQYLTDTKGNKVAAVIDIEELNRLETILELIPPAEKWLYKNKEALQSVQKGLRDVSKGKISKLNLNEL